MADLIVSARGEGEALWFLDTLMQVKLAAGADGALSILEQVAPAGSATPFHRHDATDEHFYVLEGEVVFHTASSQRRCAAGTFVSVPRGTEHAFRVSDAGPARLLVMSAEQIGQLASIGAQHDTILTGPPPAP